MKIGIPRALLYYWYGHQWEAFWQSCGWETLVSPPTDRSMLKAGSAVAVDELCLPVKIFLGHVIWLAPLVDWVMIPHLIKVEANAYVCPKFMGLPDLVAHTVPEVKSKAVIVKVGPRQVDQWRCLSTAALRLGVRSSVDLRKTILSQCKIPALGIMDSFQDSSPVDSELTIGVFGHPYCLYDSCFNLDLLEILHRNQVHFLTPELMPEDYRGKGCGKLEKELFWTIGRVQLDALEWLLNRTEGPVDGFIQITPFACGPEALVGDLLERRIKAAGLPLLKLNFEEHSGEAGMITRLEAFLDLIKFRRLVC